MQFRAVPTTQPFGPIPLPTMPVGQLQTTVFEISLHLARGWQIFAVAQVVMEPIDEAELVSDVVAAVERSQVRPSPTQPRGHSPQ